MKTIEATVATESKDQIMTTDEHRYTQMEYHVLCYLCLPARRDVHLWQMNPILILRALCVLSGWPFHDRLQSGGQSRAIMWALRRRLIRRRLDHRLHGTLTGGDTKIASERQNLVAFQLGPLFVGGADDRSPGAVDLLGHQHRLLLAVAKQVLEHVDDVVIRVLIIIEQYDVIRRELARPLRARLGTLSWLGRRLRDFVNVRHDRSPLQTLLF